MAFAKRLLLVAAALPAMTAQDVPDLYTVQVDGACDSQSFLNGLMYDRMGYTLNGHPYYKARGMEEYLYYDEDCANVGDGMARWILDNDRPALDRDADLDNDGTCSYHARINTPDGSKPPATGVWRMRCGTSWTSVTLSLTMVTSTSTTAVSSTTTSTTTTSETSTTTSTSTTSISTTTTSTTTVSSTTRSSTTTTTTTGTTTTVTTTSTTSTTSTTTSITTTTTTLMWFQVSGMCEYKEFLNDMVFRQGGYTANGAPWFKSLSGDQYVYYDVDCNGDAYGGEPRWIIDNDAPNVDGVVDMDDDGACNYHARLDTLDTTRPPAEGLWKVFCGRDWEFIEIDQSNASIASDPGEDPQSTTTSTTTTTITNTTSTTTTTITKTTTRAYHRRRRGFAGSVWLCHHSRRRQRRCYGRRLVLMRRSAELSRSLDKWKCGVKLIKKPKFDITKFMELHNDTDGDAGVAILRPEAEEAQNLITAAVQEADADDE